MNPNEMFDKFKEWQDKLLALDNIRKYLSDKIDELKEDIIKYHKEICEFKKGNVYKYESNEYIQFLIIMDLDLEFSGNKINDYSSILCQDILYNKEDNVLTVQDFNYYINLLKKSDELVLSNQDEIITFITKLIKGE